MTTIDTAIINEQLQRLCEAGGQQHGLPAGTHRGVIVGSTPAESRWGRHTVRLTIEAVGSPHAGQKMNIFVHGASLARLERLRASGRPVQFVVYPHRSDDGRVTRRIDIETITRANDWEDRNRDQAATALTVAEVQEATTEFNTGFRCLNSISAKREIVNWHDCFCEMAELNTGSLIGAVVFGSTYTFTGELRAHAASSKGLKQPGSLAGFSGKAWSPVLTFDIDRRGPSGGPDPAVAQEDAIRLVVALLELGIPADMLLVFFSGAKGFHLQVPSMAAAAVPSTAFARNTGVVCTAIAERAGIAIDHAIYQPLQPLRLPNSKHEKSGLFKIRLSVEELIDLSIDHIQSLARRPRPFSWGRFICEPVPQLAELWRTALIRPKQAFDGGTPRVQVDTKARISGATWEFLINGAREGERATSLFKAAAELAGCESAESLLRALLERPVRLSGLPPTEAAGHIDNAIKRAVADLTDIPTEWLGG